MLLVRVLLRIAWKQYFRTKCYQGYAYLSCTEGGSIYLEWRRANGF